MISWLANNNINLQLFFNQQAPVVQTLDSAIHRIIIYLVDNATGFLSTYPLDSDLQLYAVDSPIQCLNNQGQLLITVKPLKSSCHYVAFLFLAYM